MPENDSNLFGGSVDRSKLEEMKAAAGDDPERQRQVAEVQAQVDAVNESDAAAEQARQDALKAQSQQAETAQDTTAADENVQLVEGEQPDVAVQPSNEPTKYASKGEWVEYAVSRGAAREDAEADTKDNLIATYGTQG